MLYNIHIYIYINIYEMRAELTWLHDVISIFSKPRFDGVQASSLLRGASLRRAVSAVFTTCQKEHTSTRPDVTFPDRSKYIGKM